MLSEPNTVSVVTGALGDAPEIARLHADCFARNWDEATIERYLGDPGCIVKLARRPAESTPIGFLICRIGAGEAEVLTVAVEASSRIRGIANALWNAALQDIVSRGVARVVLEVDENNVPAQALYRNQGFCEVGRRKSYYPAADGGSAQDALIMALDLRTRQAR